VAKLMKCTTTGAYIAVKYIARGEKVSLLGRREPGLVMVEHRRSPGWDCDAPAD
jgi:hypothetical protein